MAKSSSEPKPKSAYARCQDIALPFDGPLEKREEAAVFMLSPHAARQRHRRQARLQALSQNSPTKLLQQGLKRYKSVSEGSGRRSLTLAEVSERVNERPRGPKVRSLSVAETSAHQAATHSHQRPSESEDDDESEDAWDSAVGGAAHVKHEGIMRRTNEAMQVVQLRSLATRQKMRYGRGVLAMPSDRDSPTSAAKRKM